MTTQANDSRYCINLRLKCFVIGYMNLIASIVDIVCHIVVVSIVSNAFQCDVSEDTLKNVDWPWLEPFLVVINLGTHGFYPFPLIMRSRSNGFLDYMPLSPQPRCYPGMLHIQMIDILNFLINIIWLKFVKAYVVALHKKDPEPMRMFFGLSLVKLILQIMYFSYQPEFHSIASSESLWFLKIFDMALASLFLYIVYKYTKQVRAEKMQSNADLPPPYIECLIMAKRAPKQSEATEKKDTEVAIPEERKDAEESHQKVDKI